MEEKQRLKNIVAIGASSVHGRGDPEGGGFVGRLRKWHESEVIGNKVYNLGISGDSTAEIINRIPIEIPPRRPDLILIQTGANDCRREESKENPPETPLYDFKENIQTIIDLATEIAPVIFVGIYPIDEAKTSPVSWRNTHYLLYDVIEYERTTQEVCKENDIPYIGLMSDWLKTDYQTMYLSPDGLHANSKGYEEIFQRIKNFLLQD